MLCLHISFHKHRTFIMSLQIIAYNLLDICSCNFRAVQLATWHVAMIYLKGNISTAWSHGELRMRFCWESIRFWTMPFEEISISFTILWQVLDSFMQFRKEKEIHHFFSKVGRKLHKPEKNIAQSWNIVTVTNVNLLLFLSKITETWTVLRNNWN